MFAIILNNKVIGLESIIEAMYYEGVQSAPLNTNKTIYVYDNGTYEIN